MKSIIIYTDPSHGWAKVSLSELFNLEIHDKISTYSYIRSNEKYSYVYLEEDVDLSTYLKALDSKGIKYKFKTYHTNKSSKIRSYNRYTLGKNYKNPFYNSDKPLSCQYCGSNNISDQGLCNSCDGPMNKAIMQSM